MIISVINTTSLHRQEVQNKIRAVTRQLSEDFRRYWHTDVQLRLEGWTGETLAPNRPLNMRDDAVIYLWKDHNTAAPLGYHDLTYRGVRSGFVFPDLSDNPKILIVLRKPTQITSAKLPILDPVVLGVKQ